MKSIFLILKDKYSRYKPEESLAYKHGFLQKPIVNIWLMQFITSSKDTVYADVVRNSNYLTITFGATPANSVRVLVQKIG